MASETIVAIFDTPAHAELAIADLKNAGIPTGAIEHFAENRESGELTTSEQPRSHGGFWSWLTGEEGHEGAASHHEFYDRSMASGHTVVTVVVDSAQADSVVTLLDQHAPLDVEQHGGTYAAADTVQGAPIALPHENATTISTEAAPSLQPAAQPARATASNEEVIPLSEETLQVGKTAIDRGVTRVRRYVVERPVEEQIRLRDEKVSVFRRPVSGAATSGIGGDAFSEKIVEMTETDEQAVVGKTSRVVEEVVVQKSAGERVETVRDNLRHEEVEITGPETKKPM